MSEKIYAAVDEEFQRRMRNWARATSGLLGDLGIAFTSAYRGFRYDRAPEAEMPTLMGDADDVNLCLQQLPPRFRQAVELFWRNEGASLRKVAAQCRPVDRPGKALTEDELMMSRLAQKSGKTGVNHETFTAWVMRGHELLEPALADHARRCRGKNAALRAVGAGA